MTNYTYGGGINIENIQLFQEVGFDEVHLSASKQIQTIEKPKISMNSSKHFDETKLSFSDIETIQTILSKRDGDTYTDGYDLSLQNNKIYFKLIK